MLATSIAETSLTLDGVSVVVDSGLARGAAFDKAAGTTHLVTSRASQAAAAQRAGRAARQGPGVAYRLWEAAAHAGRPAFQAPEMLTADLAPLVLALAQWGAADPAGPSAGFHAGMPFATTPSETTFQMSPGFSPCSHAASVRFGPTTPWPLATAA